MHEETVVTATRKWGGKGGIDPAGGVARCQGFGGTTRQAPPKRRREMRLLVWIRVHPEEDALTRLHPYHGLDSKDASEDFEVDG